jgi:uncharacterized protein (TIGR03435 family)
MHLRPLQHLLLLSTTVLAVAPLVAQDRPAAAPVARMAADAHPGIEVATVKLHDPDSRRQGWNFTADRVRIENQTLVSLMMYAFSVDPQQIVDAPEWAQKTAFGIEGVTDTPGKPNLKQQQELVQAVLADRFGLKFHREQRPLNVYAIQVAKGGPKLTPAAHPARDATQRARNEGPALVVMMGSASMKDFVLDMQFFLDRPLVDQTGLTGRYDISLRYTPDETHSTDPNAPPGLFTAIQEQLGLKLQPLKAPVDVLVIDAVQRPSEN